MNDYVPAPLPVCRERRRLPAGLVAEALAFAPQGGGAEPAFVHRELRCVLQAHTGGDHHASVMHLDGRDTGSVWARWARQQDPVRLGVLAGVRTYRKNGQIASASTGCSSAAAGFAAAPRRGVSTMNLCAYGSAPVTG